MKRLIVTADDFGLSEAVNEAVERAHRDGILSAASLMVAGVAAADAVRRARAMPSLRVGLHLVVIEGPAVLARAAIPDLLDASGRFPSDQLRLGAKYFFRPRVRRQLAAEIEAQFAAFAATGLALDHANAHKHMHLHPTVGRLMIAIGRAHGLRAIRVPAEPPLENRRLGDRALFAWTRLL
ncbi:MAG TPA: hopanoid biosynthesis-associated protein HpnK, partial [Polyangia bacterium]